MTTQISSIAKNYADGIIEYISANNVCAEGLLSNLQYILSTLKSSTEFNEILKNPAIDFSKKNEILNEIFQNEIGDAEKNIIKILIEKQRFNEFESIIEALKIKIQDLKGEKEVLITSAIELADYEKSLIISKLQSKLNKIIIPKWNISKEIIGGLIIQIDDNVIDMSLLNKITDLSKNIIR